MNSQSGQIGLVVLLIMTALLTLGVGAVTQSTSDLRNTQQEADASAAFNRADTGVERALSDLEKLQAGELEFYGDTYTGSLHTDTQDVNQAPVTYTIQKVYSINAINVKENEVNQVNLPAILSGGEVLNVSWDNCETALAVIMYKESGGNVSVERWPLACTDKVNDGTFTGFNATATGAYQFNLVPEVKLVRIRPVGGDTNLTVTMDGGTLPVQAYNITSTAQKSESKEAKAIQLVKSVQALPAIFDFALFSGNTIVM